MATEKSVRYPFEDDINPHAEQMKGEMAGWAENDQGLDEERKKVVQQGVFSHLGARMFPQASEAEIRAISRMIYWGFAKDDDKTEPEQLSRERAQTIRALRGEESFPGNTVFGQLTLLRDEFLQNLPENQQERFIGSVEHYLDGVDMEMRYKLSGEFPNLEEYLQIRERTAGQLMCIDLIDEVLGLDIPEEVIASPEVQRYRILCGRLIGFCNDFFSVYKEREQRETLNLVLVIEHEQQCSFEEAFERAIEIHDRELQEFIELKDLLSEQGEIMEKYADALAHMVSGHLAWYADSMRYGNPDADNG